MARGKKDNGFEVLIDAVSRLPWWVGLALAIISYVALHALAQPAAAGTPAPKPAWQVAKAVANAAQYIVPLACALAAALSAYRRRERRHLVANATTASAPDALHDMTWHEFEQLVGEGFRQQGYQVAETGGGGADGGIDLVLRKDREKFLVQCKQWKAFKVGVTTVRELYGVMAAQGAAGGFVVTSGRFTEEANAFASGKNIRLVDGPKLLAVLKQAKSARTAPAATRTAAPRATGPTEVLPTPKLAASDPTCPICESTMVLRTARRGANAGGTFWGCAKYPACRGTRPAELS